MLKERDGESGLDYFVARHYSSWMGRFMQPDLFFADQHVGDPQSWNLYAYVRNNVLNLIDPTGRRQETVCRDERVPVRVGHKDEDGSYGYTVTTVCNVVWYPDPPPTGRGGSGNRGSGVDLGSIARGATAGGDEFFARRRQGEQRRPHRSADSNRDFLEKLVHVSHAIESPLLDMMVTGAFFVTAGAHFVVGPTVLAAGCTGGGPVGCAAGGFGLATAWSAGSILATGGALYAWKTNTLGIRSMVSYAQKMRDQSRARRHLPGNAGNGW